MAKPLSEISLRILEVMKQHPQGISEGEIREILQIPPAEQANFGRRRRELNYLCIIEKRQEGPKVVYIYKGPRPKPRDTSPIGVKLRAEAFHFARGRCANCGRTIEKHNIVLVVDHKIPREWGGLTESGNLWAICEDCNAGKKNYFKSVDADWMREVMKNKDVRVRLGETLKAFKGEPVDAATLEFIANQDDWKKRIRDLRYLGWVVRASRKRMPNGRVRSFYQLMKARAWPENPSAVVQKYERDRAARNRAKPL